jgi:surfactin synthase thioesterase subunit
LVTVSGTPVSARQLALWRQFADDVDGRPVAGGHFFAEEHPLETAQALRQFLAAPNAPLNRSIAGQGRSIRVS